MNNRQLAHVWAQQTKTQGKGHHFYFEGPSIYSYGPHFEIARFVTVKKKRAVLFTTRTYSVSTSKHLSYTRTALHGLAVPVFNVTSLDADHKANTKDYAERIDTAARKATLVRSHAETRMQQAATLTDEANAYAKLFGLKARIKKPVFGPALKAKINAEKQRKAEKTRQDHARLLVELEKWKRGEDVAHRYCFNEIPTGLRVRGEVVETSRGAEVPLDHAKRLWPIVQRVKASGVAYQRNGHTEHVGHFTVDRIETSGDLSIGCHRIAFAEVERIAKELGL
jgi:hypothetical protein